MSQVLWLLVVQGALGGLDTLYYHEWRARLPALGRAAHAELKLHAVRDFIYAIIFGTLPWLAWKGLWVVALTALLFAEIVITLADFIVEDRVRKPLGGVYHGERAMHAVMGLVYGSILAYLLPVMARWWGAPTALVRETPDVPEPLRWTLYAMAIGVLISGVRDLCAVMGLPHSNWPWQVPKKPEIGI